MTISLIQALLIGAWTAFCYCGVLWGTYTNRAIVLSFGVGIILGDIPTALSMGAIAELAFMGFGVGAGGTVPPNPIGPGIIGTILCITNKSITPESALALSLPFAVAIQFLQTLIFSLCATNESIAKNALDNLNFKKFKFAANITLYLFVVAGFSVGFIGAYSSDLLTSLVNMIPQWLLDGLKVAGGMLPAIGFAMIISVMAKKELLPFLLLGYICSAYFKLPVIGIALVGLVFALKEYHQTPAVVTETKNNEEVAQDDWI